MEQIIDIGEYDDRVLFAANRSLFEALSQLRLR